MPLDTSDLSAGLDAVQTQKKKIKLDLDSLLEAEGASHLKPVVEAIYGQESGSGANRSTSIDGARGGMQIMPDTFKGLARAGESIDNPDDNMRVGIRYIKQLGDKFGNDPARIAAGYFSGPGNVAAAGDVAYRKDHADGNGKRVSSYVKDVMDRLVPSAQAAEPGARPPADGVALAREIAGGGSSSDGLSLAREIAGLGASPEPQAAEKPAETSFIDKAKDFVGWNKGRDIQIPEGQTVTDDTFTAGVPEGQKEERRMASVMNGTAPEAVPPIEYRGAPVDEKTYLGIKAIYDGGGIKRDALLARSDWRGEVARAIKKSYTEQDAVVPGDAARKVDPRAEARYAEQIAQGAAPDTAANIAKQAALARVAPGTEAPGSIKESEVDPTWGDNGAYGKVGTFAAGEVAATGATLTDLGRRAGIDSVSALGDAMQNWSARKMPANPTFADEVVNAFGSSASFFLPGLGVAKGTQALAILAPTAAKWAGAGTMAVLEAAAESDQAYKLLRRQGHTDESASERATAVFLKNVALLGITDKMGYFNDLKSVAGRVLAAKANEGFQEGSQRVIQNSDTDQPLGEGVAREALIGGLVGGGTALAREGASVLADKIDPNGAALRELNDLVEGAQFAPLDRPDVVGDVVPKPLQVRPPAAGAPTANPLEDPAISSPIADDLAGFSSEEDPVIGGTPVSQHNEKSLSVLAGAHPDPIVREQAASALQQKVAESQNVDPELEATVRSATGDPNARVLSDAALPAAGDSGSQGATRETAAVVRAVLDISGREPVWYAGSGPDGFALTQGQPNRVFLNANAGQIAPLVTAGHEVFHLVEQEKDLRDTFRATVDRVSNIDLSTDDGLLAYAETYHPQALAKIEREGKKATAVIDELLSGIGNGYSRDTLRGEFYNDVFGNRWHEPSFYKALIKELARTDVGLLGKFKSALDLIIKQVAGMRGANFAADKFLKDIEPVRQEAARVYAAYASRQSHRDRLGKMTPAELLLAKKSHPDDVVRDMAEAELKRREIDQAYKGNAPAIAAREKAKEKEVARAQYENKQAKQDEAVARAEAIGTDETPTAMTQALAAAKKDVKSLRQQLAKEMKKAAATARGAAKVRADQLEDNEEGRFSPKRETASDHKMQITREERELADKTKLTREELKRATAGAAQFGLKPREVEMEVRRIKARFPESAGWAPLEFLRVDPKTMEKKASKENPLPSDAIFFVEQPYQFHLDASKKANDATRDERVKTMASALAGEITERYMAAQRGDKVAQVIMRQADWYAALRAKLRATFGGFGDFFAQLLGPTSANNPVEPNFKYAAEALQMATSGKWDKLFKAAYEWKTGIEDAAKRLDTITEEYEAKLDEVTAAAGQYKGKEKALYLSSNKKRLKAEYNPQIEAAKADVKLAAVYKGPLPLRENSKMFGMASKQIAQILGERWGDKAHGDAPKTKNYYQNIMGRTIEATIDVWAARTLRRLANEKIGDFPRIPTVAEGAVAGSVLVDNVTSGSEFGFGQDVFREAAAELRSSGIEQFKNTTPDAVQAMIWFSEKEVWARRNWTTKVGEEGSIEHEMLMAGYPDREQLDAWRVASRAGKPNQETKAFQLKNKERGQIKYEKAVAAWEAAKEEAIQKLGEIERYPDRFVAGITAEIPGDKPADGELATISREIENAIGDDKVMAKKAQTSTGEFMGDFERTLDVELVARNDYDATPLWNKLVEVSDREGQMATFLSRVLRADEAVDPLKHRPGVELYFVKPITLAEAQPLMDLINEAGVHGMTMVTEGRRTPGALAGQDQPIAGIRMQHIPEFMLGYGYETGLSDAEISARVDEARKTMEGLVSALTQRSDVATATRHWYETRVHFYGNAEGNPGSRSGLGAGEVWSGQRIREALENSARFNAEHQGALGARRAEVLGQRQLSRSRAGQARLSPGRSGTGNEGRPGGAGAPGYGTGQQGSVSLTGVHYSKAQRDNLAGYYFGQGMKGAERARLQRESATAEQRRRIHFYVDEGNGLRPESDVGDHAHATQLDNLYDWVNDPLNLWAEARDAYKEPLDRYNKMEQLIMARGFDGLYGPGAQGNQGVAVLLGSKHTGVPVQYLGTGYRGGDVVSQAPAPVKAERKDLPAGRMSGAEWKKLVPEATHLEDGKEYYRSDLRLSPPRLAPNGKPSNLTEAQWHQVRTPKFKAWFGDWEKHTSVGSLWSDPDVSKVVDENGEPLVVYHGTEKGGFTTMRPEKGDKHRSPMLFAAKTRNTARSYARVGDEIDLSIPEYEGAEARKIGKDWFVVNKGGDGSMAYNVYGDYVDQRDAEGYFSKKEAEYFRDNELEQIFRDNAVVQRGVYSLFLNIRNPNEANFEGANWDGDANGLFEVRDGAGDNIYGPNGERLMDHDAATALAEKEGGEVWEADGYMGETTNSVAEEARRFGNDGAIIREVVDDGGKGGYVERDDVFVFFNSNQAKSATQNTGAFSSKNDDLRYSPARWYFSNLAKTIEEAPDRVFGPAGQVKLWLAGRPGIKKEERQWTGIDEWLDLKGKQKVSKQEVLDFLSANGVQVEEVEKGVAGFDENNPTLPDGYFVADVDEYIAEENPRAADFKNAVMDDKGVLYGLGDNDNEAILDAYSGHPELWEKIGTTKFAQYVLPGGENYRELLLTLPARTRDRASELKDALARWQADARAGKRGEFSESEIASMRVDDILPTLEEEYLPKDKAYRSAHWDEPNILAHIRFNERTDAEGRRVLFIEEIQSDWGQEGKKTGFGAAARKTQPLAPGEYVAFVDRMKAAAAEEINRRTDGKLGLDVARGVVDSQPLTQIAEWAGMETEYAILAEQNLDDATPSKNRVIPPAPFVTDTKSWVALALKRMMHYAAANGFDTVAWTTGAQQAERYDLSKQVDSIAASKNPDGTWYIQAEKNGGFLTEKSSVDEGALADVVGKDLAEKIISESGKEVFRDGAPFRLYSGIDLKVGGEGMAGFYDKIVPQVASKLLEKMGGKVGVVQIDNTPQGGVLNFRSAAEGGTYRDANDRVLLDQPGFPVPPLAGQPQALFSPRRQTETPEFKAWFGDSKVVNPDGTPREVYHGTTRDFTVFKRTKGNAGGDFGRGFYLTSSTEDASANYAGIGPDLASNITIMAEQIAGSKGWEYDDPRALDQAQKKLYGGADHIIPAYVRMVNPLVLPAKGYTDRRVAMKFVNAIRTGMGKEAITREAQIQLMDLYEAAQEERPFDVLLAKARNAAQYAEDSKGNLIMPEVVRKAIERAGFDGIIDNSVSNKWGEGSKNAVKMKGVMNDTTHYIAFHPEQIKSAIGNNGQFDPNNPDIRYSPDRFDAIAKAFTARVTSALSAQRVTAPVLIHSNTPASMQILGWADRRLVLEASELTKIANKSGFETDDRIGELIHDLGRPGAMFWNEKQGSLNILRQKDMRGAPALIAVRPDVAVGAHHRDHLMVTAHRLDNQEALLRKITSGELKPLYLETANPVVKAAMQTRKYRVTVQSLAPENLHARAELQLGTAPRLLSEADLVKWEGEKWGDKPLFSPNRLVQRLDAAIDGLSNLPDQFDYLKDRYLALGKVARVDEIIKEIRSVLDTKPGAEKAAVYTYLTTRGAPLSMIGDPEARAMAKRMKDTINYVGDALVARGLLDPRARAHYKDQYLPRLYLRHLMDDATWKMFGAGKKPSDMGYLKERKDIPAEVRELVYGEIKDPSFLGANAIGRAMRDIALLDWLGRIAQHKDWVYPDAFVNFRGQKVTSYWLKAEADRIETQIPHYEPGAQQRAQQLIAAMRQAASTANLDHLDHKLFKQIPDTMRYGMLRGMWVRKEIYNDIMGASQIVNADPTWFEQLFGFGGVGSKTTQWWKFLKVAANPPGQIRNFVSNMVMLQLSGVGLHKLPIRLIQAAKEITNDGPHWKVAKKYGVTESTFTAQELYRVRQDLITLENQISKANPLTFLQLAAGHFVNKISDLYQFSEALGKTIKIIDEMEKGKTEAEAAIEAQKWLFDYSLVPQGVRLARNAPIGTPFITYTIKVLPRLLEVATTAPWRFLPWLGLIYGMQSYVASLFGVDDDDLKKLKKSLPKWLQDRGHTVFLPFKDSDGRVQVADVGYFFPWTFYTQAAKNLVEEGPVKVIKDDIMGQFSAPLIGAAQALATNYDTFTKKPIYNESDPTSYKAAAIANFAYDLMVPPFISSHGVVSPMGLLDKKYGGKLVQAQTGTTNKFGDPKATTEQALTALFGLNFYGMDPEHSRITNIQVMLGKVKDAETSLKQRLMDRGLTDEQRAKVMADYREKMLELGEEAKKYAEESEVPEKLKATR